MYKKIKPSTTDISRNTSYVGETIEQKINRIVNNKEPIKDGAPLIYTERKDGVNKAYNIRTDRWEVAIEAMDKVNKSHIAKREHSLGETAKHNQKLEEKTETKGNNNSGAEPTQAT